MMVRDTGPFLFVGGWPAIDFVNTEIVLRGEPVDLLAGQSDLLRWLAASGLGTAEERTSLAAAKRLRSDLRKVFVRLAEGHSLRSADLQGINAALAGTAGRLRLDIRHGRPHLETTFGAQPSPLFLIARAAAEFLATADLSLVRRCEGAGCILLFYDTTKSHTRRWCSMAVCGNRAKAAAHYERTRG